MSPLVRIREVDHDPSIFVGHHGQVEQDHRLASASFSAQKHTLEGRSSTEMPDIGGQLISGWDLRPWHGLEPLGEVQWRREWANFHYLICDVLRNL